MRLRPFLADDLPDLKLPQRAHHPRSQRQADGQRRQARSRRTERDVARHVQRGDLRVKRIEQMEEHQPRSAFSRSTTRSVFTPRDPLTRTRSPRSTPATIEAAAFSIVRKYRTASRGIPAATAASAI